MAMIFIKINLCTGFNKTKNYRYFNFSGYFYKNTFLFKIQPIEKISPIFSLLLQIKCRELNL